MEKLKTIVHCILSDVLKNENYVHDLCRMRYNRTTGTVCCLRQRLNHSPYSPDLSPPNYFAFPKLKMELKEGQYATISDIQTSVTTKLKTIPITDFSRVMHQLEDRANQCIAVNSDYFELKKFV